MSLNCIYMYLSLSQAPPAQGTYCLCRYYYYYSTLSNAFLRALGYLKLGTDVRSSEKFYILQVFHECRKMSRNSYSYKICRFMLTCQDYKKSLLVPWCNPNRKSAILNLCFKFYNILQRSYFNKLLLIRLSDRPQTWSAYVKDLREEKLLKVCPTLERRGHGVLQNRKWL